jgi:hypothetical protein
MRRDEVTLFTACALASYLLALLLALTGCEVPLTSTPTALPGTETPAATVSAPPGATDTALPPTMTLTPSLTPSVTPTHELVYDKNILLNPGLFVDSSGFPQDGAGGTLRVAEDWRIGFNPDPDTHPCAEGQTFDCNTETVLGQGFKPEAKPVDLDPLIFNFALADNGQQWFCFRRVCDVALYQTVAVQPGSVCHFGVLTLDYQVNGNWYQGHSDPPDASGHASNWSMGVSFNESLPWQDESSALELDSWQEWDRASLHTVEFLADGPLATVFIRNQRGYPITHQESVVYAADLRCTGSVVATPIPTPTPIVTPGGPTLTPEPPGLVCDAFAGHPFFLLPATNALTARSAPQVGAATLTGWAMRQGQGGVTSEACAGPGEQWYRVRWEPSAGVVRTDWFAAMYAGVVYAEAAALPPPTPTPEPEPGPEPVACADIEGEATRRTDYEVLEDIGNIPVLDCPSANGETVGHFGGGRTISGTARHSDGSLWVYATGECLGEGGCSGWVEFIDAEGQAKLCRAEMCRSSAIGWNSNLNLGLWWYAGAPFIYVTEDMDFAVSMSNDPHNNWGVFAFWTLGDDFWRAGGKDHSAQAMAEEWARVMDYFILHMNTRSPGPNWDKICFAGYNEPVFSTDADGTAEEKAIKYAEFELWRMRLADERGVKACVGKFSTGTPDYPIYPLFDEMFRYASEHGHPVLVHEYGGCVPLLWRGEAQNAAFAANDVEVFDLRHTEEAHLVGRFINIPYDPIILIDEAGADFVGTGPPVSEWCGGVARGWKSWAPLWRARWHDDAVRFLREQAVSAEFPPATRAYIAEIAAQDTLTDEQLAYAYILAIDIILRRYGAWAGIFVLGNHGGWNEFDWYGAPARWWQGYQHSYYQ